MSLNMTIKSIWNIITFKYKKPRHHFTISETKIHFCYGFENRYMMSNFIKFYWKSFFVI